jgi:hypothetical protein
VLNRTDRDRRTPHTQESFGGKQHGCGRERQPSQENKALPIDFRNWGREFLGKLAIKASRLNAKPDGSLPIGEQDFYERGVKECKGRLKEADGAIISTSSVGAIKVGRRAFS